MEQTGMKHFLFLFIVISLLLSFPFESKGTKEKSVEAMLREFIRDYVKNDKLPDDPVVVGIKVTYPEEEKWSIYINAKSPQKVTLRKGFPKEPTVYLITDYKTLKKIYDGELNALTAAGRARMSDKTPLDFGFMEGYQPPSSFIPEIMLPLFFHFFNRGKPEIIPFGEKFSRFVHGGNTVIFYYQRGLRTAWYQVKKGMIINKDLNEAVNPFPTLFIITKGEGKGRLGEKTLPLKEGMTIFVPSGMIHQFWTASEAGMEFVIIMFGEGA